MEFKLSIEQSALQDSVRRFCEKRYTQPTRLALVRDGGFSLDNWRAIAEQGWLGAAISVESGGSGATPVDMAIVEEEFGRSLVPESLLPAIMCGAILERAGDSFRESLRDLLAGQSIFALAHNEPQACGRIRSVETGVQRVAGGLKLRGLKTVTIAGSHADKLIVSARDAGEQRAPIRLFLLDVTQEGICRRPGQLLDGTDACTVILEDVDVSDAQSLLEPADSIAALEHAFDLGIVGACAESVGAMTGALMLTRDHLRTRRQYGTTLSTLQALQHRMADMFAETELSRSILHAGLAALSEQTASPEDRRAQLAAMKSQVARSGRFVASEAIQLHGGMGMTAEHAAGSYFKRLKVLEASFGYPALHARRYANFLLRDRRSSASQER